MKNNNDWEKEIEDLIEFDGYANTDKIIKRIQKELDRQREELLEEIEKMRPEKRKMKMVTDSPTYEYKSGWVVGRYGMFEEILSKLKSK